MGDPADTAAGQSRRLPLKPALVIGAMSLVATATQAQILDFEGIGVGYPFAPVNILYYYNGGTSAVGTSGTNFGVTFSPNALAFCLTRRRWTARTRRGCASARLTGLSFVARHRRRGTMIVSTVRV